MGKKNMDILFGNILGNTAIKPQDRYENPAAPLPENDAPAPSAKGTTKEHSDDSWRHFSFICSKALVDKVQAIAHKEGFTIRSFMEYVMKQGIEVYESKQGKENKVERTLESSRIRQPVYFGRDMNLYIMS